MSPNPSENSELAALLKANGVVPLKILTESLAVKGVTLDTRGKAQPKTEEVLESNGFIWDQNNTIYRSDRGYQAVVAYPSRIYVWSYASVGKFLPNTSNLSAWISGPNQKFINELMQLTGESDPINVGSATERPAPPSQEQEIDNILKKIKPGTRMKADAIIDLYKKAKNSENEKLMNLVKTLQVQESIKNSDLRMILKEIVKGILKEVVAMGDSDDDSNKNFKYSSQYSYKQPEQDPTEKWVEDFANTTWKDSQDIGKGEPGVRWKVSKTKRSDAGETVYLLKKTKRIDLSRFVIQRGDQWYYLDPNSKKWIEMSERPPVKEMTTTAAVAPVQTPIAFKKKNEEQIEEMTTTDTGTPGYMIPGAFSRKGGSKKGIEGSAALGYTLTPIGKKEMKRTGDPLK